MYIVTFFVNYDLIWYLLVCWAEFMLIFFNQSSWFANSWRSDYFITQNNINSITFCKMSSHSYNSRSDTSVGDSNAVETSELISNLGWTDSDLRI